MGLASAVEQLLRKRGTEASRKWFESYVKGTRWHGCKVPIVRQAVKDVLKETKPHPNELYAAGFELLRSEFCDAKLGGMILMELELFAKASKCEDSRNVLFAGDDKMQFLRDMAALFDGGFVDDWSTCDWLCMRCLGPWCALHPFDRRAAAEYLMSWSLDHSGSVWKRRSSHVSFIKYIEKTRSQGNADPRYGVALFGDGFYERLIETCDNALEYRERFASTGAGWALRYLILQKEQAVVQVLRKRAQTTLTAEGVRYALEKSNDKKLREELLLLVRGQEVDGSQANDNKSEKNNSEKSSKSKSEKNNNSKSGKNNSEKSSKSKSEKNSNTKSGKNNNQKTEEVAKEAKTKLNPSKRKATRKERDEPTVKRRSTRRKETA